VPTASSSWRLGSRRRKTNFRSRFAASTNCKSSSTVPSKQGRSSARADHSAQLDRINLLLYGIVVAHEDASHTLARLATAEGVRRNRAIAKARTRRKLRKKRDVSRGG